MRVSIAVAALVLSAFAARANDGVYFVNGSHLEPLQETDIAVKSEVLTITIRDDGFAYVEVDYQFLNNGQAKDVTMGFEAKGPYNAADPIDLKGSHPYIMDFSVVMNGKALGYRNGVVFADDFEGQLPKEVETARKKGKHFIPVDFRRWRYDDENSERLYNSKTDEYADFAFAYYFDAHFNQGLNTVRHTYRYRMSFGVGRAFEIPYWLLPAMRWANHQIDDFTLRVRADNCTKHFYIDCPVFCEAPFRVLVGKGKTRRLSTNNDEGSSVVTEVVLRDGTLVWHQDNFRTDYDMGILSADQLDYSVDWGDAGAPVYYDSGVTYLGWIVWGGNYSRYFPNEGTEEETDSFAALVQSSLPYAHRGYVFKNDKLRRYYESQWWYMPDPSWKPDDSSFNQHEREINNLEDGIKDE